MKRFLMTAAAVLAFAVAAGGTAGCASGGNYAEMRVCGKPTAAVVPSRQAVERGLAGYMNFAAGLLAEAEGRNPLVSPFAAMNVLGMALAGADGRTADELAAALGMGKDEVPLFALSAAATAGAGGTEVDAAHSLWLRTSFAPHVKEGFKETVSRYYGPEVYAVQFDESAPNLINKWVFDKTGGMIKRVFERFEPEDEMVLVSALAVRGEWLEPAEKMNTDIFTDADGATREAEYFYGKSALYVCENALAVKRYLRGGLYLMAVTGKDGKVPRLSGDELFALVRTPDPQSATYEIPEFSAEYACSLLPALRALGITDAFSPFAADFSALSDREDGLFIGEADQKSTITVDRKGVKAASVVRTGFKSGSSTATDETTPHIKFDRPFSYFIMSECDVPLFAGRFDGPSRE